MICFDYKTGASGWEEISGTDSWDTAGEWDTKVSQCNRQ